jgi:hypothetical protein
LVKVITAVLVTLPLAVEVVGLARLVAMQFLLLSLALEQDKAVLAVQV